ncbi:MAG: DUF2007 domain-containing protein [Gammaproteobacteria bacterium]|nr:DUF2007 domain-containing protein [Gammaproteobacteria bacterium]
MQIIYKASDVTEAHIVAGLLHANGIESHVGGHYLQGAIGDIAAFDFANVQIDDEDIVLAQSIIHAYENNQEKPVEDFKKHTLADKLLIVLLLSLLVIFILYLSIR